jgi:hypothetical protein
MSETNLHPPLLHDLNPVDRFSDRVDNYVRYRPSYAQPLLTSPHFTNVREYTVANRQALDLVGLIGRVRSNSYIPSEGAVLQQLTSDLEKLYERFQDDRGLVYLNYSTSIHLAEPPSLTSS